MPLVQAARLMEVAAVRFVSTLENAWVSSLGLANLWLRFLAGNPLRRISCKLLASHRKHRLLDQWCNLELWLEVVLLLGTKYDLNRFWCQLCHGCVVPPFCRTCCIIAIGKLRMIRRCVPHKVFLAGIRHLHQAVQVVGVLESLQVWVIPVTRAFLLRGLADHVGVLLAQKCLVILILAFAVGRVLPERAVPAHDCPCMLLGEL